MRCNVLPLWPLDSNATGQHLNRIKISSILKLPAQAEATAGVTIVTPLGTLLPPGIGLQVDTGDRRAYPFGWCSPVGCFARFGLDDASLAALKRGKASCACDARIR